MLRRSINRAHWLCRTLIRENTLNLKGADYSNISFSWRSHTCGELRSNHVGRDVTLCGWTKRPQLLESQGICFVPLTDATGVIQLIFQSADWADKLSHLASETVVKVKGVVLARPSYGINKDLPTGAIEVQIQSMEVLNEVGELPFSVSDSALNEELRLRERHLDLRRPTMQKNLRLRSDVGMAVREFLVNENAFVEVETPTLFKRTAEGAREFLVPTRDKGKFYALVQSPQQFKQLLMVGGFDRYFQFARCYRDEDLRADRQPEFTQIDIEMSFIDEEGIMGLIEQLLMHVLSTAGVDKKPVVPFPRMSYSAALSQYGSDKPDTRYDMKIHRTSQFGIRGFKVSNWKSALALLSKADRKLLDDLLILRNERVQFFLVHNESVKTLDGNPSYGHDFVPSELRSEMSAREEDLCVVGRSLKAGSETALLTELGKLRTTFASVLQKTGHLTLDPSQLNFLWIVDFPLFTPVETLQGIAFESTHHPFTAPRVEDEVYLNNPTMYSQILGRHYDIVLNGIELGGGSIRIHDAIQQEHVFKNILKVSPDQFLHLLKGLRSGCPPHGGIALGFDRLMALLCHAESLRDVIAFPKSFRGKDLLTGAPADVDKSDLKEYHISLNTTSVK